MIFFDHNSTTRISERALSKMNLVHELPLNNSAIHQFGRKADFYINEASERLLSMLHAENYNVIFTSSATEATNTAFFGLPQKKILFSTIEHSSVFNCRPSNKEIIEISAEKNGQISLSNLSLHLEKISSDFVLSLMHANNETGVIQPVAKSAKLVHQKGGLIHCDIVQSVSKIRVNLEELNVDLASISAHKFGGPQGVGALLYRKGIEISPLILGSKQQKGIRAGTLNIAGISGFGEACQETIEGNGSFAKTQKILELRNYLEKSIQEIAGENVLIFGQNEERLPNTSFVSLRNSEAQIQVMNFDINGICISAGSACSSGQISQSRVLRAMNVKEEFLRGAIRISLSNDSELEEVNKFINVWQKFYLRTLI